MKNKIKTIVIPVAGKGTRFLPVTKSISKTLFPIINKPVILHLLEEGFNAGVKNFILIINNKEEDLKDFLSLDSSYYDLLDKSYPELSNLDNLLKQINITYIVQDKLNGLGGAIYQCKDYIKEDAFGLILGDDLVLKDGNSTYGIKSLIDKYNIDEGYYLGVKEVPYLDTSKYGILDIKDKLVLNIVEKPKDNPPSNLACVGRYILKANIFSYLENIKVGLNNELQLTDALNLAIKNDAVYYSDFLGSRYDIGCYQGFVLANLMEAKNKGILDEILDKLK